MAIWIFFAFASGTNAKSESVNAGFSVQESRAALSTVDRDAFAGQLVLLEQGWNRIRVFIPGAEGIDLRSIRLVGNVMIDTLVRLLPRADPSLLLKTLGLMTGLGPRSYVLVTLHRPSNVDDEAMLTDLLRTLTQIAQTVPVVFPMHPRTRARVRPEQLGSDGLMVTEPMTYLDFLGFQRHASVVVTDSGGIQEETTFLGVPCLTMRKTTERPVTVTLGTNELLGRDTEKLKRRTREILDGHGKAGVVPPLWDGKAAERVAQQIVERAL